MLVYVEDSYPYGATLAGSIYTSPSVTSRPSDYIAPPSSKRAKTLTLTHDDEEETQLKYQEEFNNERDVSWV